jgi:hypothetical protein
MLLLISPKILIDPDTETSGAPIRIHLDRILDQLNLQLIGRPAFGRRACAQHLPTLLPNQLFLFVKERPIDDSLLTMDHCPLVVELTGIEPVTLAPAAPRSP